MGERPGVHHDRRAPPARGLDRVEKLALAVGLEVLERVPGDLGRGAGVADTVVERVSFVDLRLALTEQV